MTAYTAASSATNILQNPITQTAHGFHAGQAIVFNGTTYVLSQSDVAANCAGTMMVSTVLSADQFIATQTGYITNLTSTYVDGGVISLGVQYYVSQTNAGNLSTTMPTTAGTVVLACCVFITSTTAYFYGGSGVLNEPGSLFAWNVTTVNTVMSVNNGYVINGAGPLTMTLPPTSSVGDIIEVAGFGANGWIIAQNAGQVAHFGNMSTTVGVGGSLASTVRYDSIKLLSVTASPNAEWLVLTADGNITIV